MVDYETFCQIRDHLGRQQLTVAQTARALALHPRTVAKWAGEVVPFRGNRVGPFPGNRVVPILGNQGGPITGNPAIEAETGERICCR